jgi:diguanylate cyclase (GGDEF)-like protein
VRGIVCNTRDITETRELQERLEHAANHDALTGLPNRVLLVERLTAELDTGVTVVLADLNEFKLINDTFGHAVGDELLTTVAERMRRAVRPQDTVGRLGGDEFALVLAGNDRIAADAVLDRLVRALDEPVTVDGLSLTVRASLGVALSQRKDDVNELIRRADLAMYDAKRERLNRWRYYEAEPAVPARRA